MDSSNFDRRIGDRHEVDGVEIGWYFGVPGGPDAPVTIEKVTGYLVDVSASGAGVVAPHSRDIWIGCLVGFEFRNLQGTVRIRRIDRLPAEKEFRLYGIEFTAPNSDLVTGLCDTFLARYSQVSRWRDPRYAPYRPPLDPDAVILANQIPDHPTTAKQRSRLRRKAMPAALDAGALGADQAGTDSEPATAP